MTQHDDPKLSFISIEKLTTPPHDLCKVIHKAYWAIHPEKGAILYRGYSPQCNTNIEITRKFVSEHGLYPWAIVCYIPVAYLSINLKDYV